MNRVPVNVFHQIVFFHAFCHVSCVRTYWTCQMSSTDEDQKGQSGGDGRSGSTAASSIARRKGRCGFQGARPNGSPRLGVFATVAN